MEKLEPQITTYKTEFHKTFATMLDKNELKSGLIVGLALPLIGAALLFITYRILEATGWASQEGLTSYFRFRTISLLAICLNIIPMRRFYGNRFAESMRGVVLATFIYGIIWIFLFRSQLFVQ